MSSSHAPGERKSVIATKATAHGEFAVEGLFPGRARKSAQAAPAVPNAANATAAQQIAIGEEFVIISVGEHPISAADLPSTAAPGTRSTAAIYIQHSDNALVLAATATTSGVLQAGYSKLGLLTELDGATASVSTTGKINLSRRDTF
jgi:hypothetical protein